MSRNYLTGALCWVVIVGMHSAPSVSAAEKVVRHVVFENGAGIGGYYHSQANSILPSRFDAAASRIPLERRRFVSPGNSLRLSWTSAQGGDWRATIRVEDFFHAQQFPFAGDTLVMQCFATGEITPLAAPRMAVRDSAGRSLPEMLLTDGGEILPGKWVELRFPLAHFSSQYKDTSDRGFDIAQLKQISFAQGLDDGEPHEVFLDDIRLVANAALDKTAPRAPEGLTASGSDRHIDLRWQANSEPDLLSYRVYRASKESDFEPILTRRADFLRGVDFLGAPNRQAQYRIAAVDLSGNESPPSEVATAETRELTDSELLDMVQEACFRFYWEAAEKHSGMAVEVLPGDPHLIALGGSGFGITALPVAIERGFITRDQAVERLQKILSFLEHADRFHGAWPHFLDGRTGKVWPLFGKYDNGGDLVESAFLMQGLLTCRQYFDRDTDAERQIRATITRLWEEVEWDWYRKTPDSEVLYWHWSPDHQWHISHPLVGWNETMIVYLLAIASPTHSVPASLYHTGWAGQSDFCVDYRHGWSRTTDGDHYTNGHEYYGHRLDVGCGPGGDLFFAQFSFLGFDPRGRRDRSTNYFHNNRQLALINRAYCVANPREHEGYGPDCWGISAGIHAGGGKPEPRNDNGTICCSASIGCMPYVPEESLAALKHMYREWGHKTWGVYGFHDGFNPTEDWFDECYMGLNQAQIVVGIENYRTGLCWNRFMRNPEIGPMLEKIGFTPDQTAATAE